MTNTSLAWSLFESLIGDAGMFIFMRVSAAVSLALAMFAPGAHAATCTDEATIKSPQETTAADITFRNPTAEKRRVYWIDFEGKRKFYATIDAGQLLKQKTYVGHTWIITNDAETCLYVISASAAPITVDLGDTAAAVAPPPAAPVPPLPAAAAPATAPPATAAVAVPQTAVVSPVSEISPVERYRLEGRYRLMSRADNRKALNNQDSGTPELVETQVQWDSAHWEFEAIPGTALVWIKNSWKSTYLTDDQGKLRVSRTLAGDENGQWLMEAVDGEPYVRIKSKGGDRYLIAGGRDDVYLDSRIGTDRDGQWQFIPTAWPRPVAATPKPRIERRVVKADDDDDEPVKRRKGESKDPRDDGYINNKARNSARASCAETGGYWTGKTCKAFKTSKPGKCKKGWAWSEDAGACQFDGGDPAPKTNNANINRGNCGPGFISKNGNCVSQANGKATPEPKLTTQQKINQGIEILNAIVNKCPKGQVWNQAEGCHEDD